MWQYTQSRLPNQGAAVYKSMVTNTNKEITNFSDYLFPETDPVYPTHWQVIQYIHAYAGETESLISIWSLYRLQIR